MLNTSLPLLDLPTSFWFFFRLIIKTEFLPTKYRGYMLPLSQVSPFYFFRISSWETQIVLLPPCFFLNTSWESDIYTRDPQHGICDDHGSSQCVDHCSVVSSLKSLFLRKKEPIVAFLQLIGAGVASEKPERHQLQVCRVCPFRNTCTHPRQDS